MINYMLIILTALFIISLQTQGKNKIYMEIIIQFSNFFQLFLPSVLYTGIFYHHTGIQPGTIKNRKQVVYHKFGLDGMHSETSSSPH